MTHSIETIFSAARELHGDARQEYLHEACADDSGLRSRIEALLAADVDAGSFLKSAKGDSEANGFSTGIPGGPEIPSETAGQWIGKYKLLQNIGEGGFGTVWMAEQKEPVRRMVALKVIKLGMDTKQIVARFEAERQALALLEHPNIAKVFDAGSTETGRPYFVMELVRGVPILEYCDTKRLDTTSRLNLFALVCNAIQHAHQKGIIHRDIKPGNILVTLHDGVPVPKVIDFGIAKATNQELTQKTLFTELHQLVGTPAYMSPEQAEMSGLDIDTRSDIYSLGVLLYELLTGTTPFAHKELMERGFGEMMRIIREDTPHKPSTRLSTLGNQAMITAEQRHADVKKLGFILRGDLDWIVMKCLEKDRSRRYDTASGLAEDIVRHLSDEPVIAGPPGTRYKLRKFVKRHRGRVAAAGVIAAILVLGVVGTSYGMISAIHERDNARAAELETAKRASELEQVAEFQAEQLGEIDPHQMGIMLRQSLVEGVPEDQRNEFEQRLAQINFTNIALGALEESIFQRTIEAIDTQFSDQPIVLAQMLKSTGKTLYMLGLLELAEGPQTRALAIQRNSLGDDHPDTLGSIGNVGSLLKSRGRLDEAEGYYREALEGWRRVFGDDHPKTLNAVNNMGSFLYAQGKRDEAVSNYSEALEGRRRVLGNDHLDTLISITSMGAIRNAQGDREAAEVLNLEALEISRRTLGNDHPRTLNALNNMGSLKYGQGQLPEAEAYLREALEGSRRVLGDDHPRTLKSINNLGVLLDSQGKSAEAEPLYREALERRSRVLGERHSRTLMTTSDYGGVLNDLGRFEEAAELLRGVAEAAHAVWADNAGELGNFVFRLGISEEGLRQYQQAETALLEAYPLFEEAYGPIHAKAQQCAQRLASLYEFWHTEEPGSGYDAKALAWRELLSEPD